jgi:large subunit ribosomal protein L4
MTTHTIDVRSADGEVVGSADLDEAVFGIEPNVAVMHQVVVAQLAAARAGTHNTKTRAEVAGGGRKPFRQKGTGRARQGSIRAPQWTGGGVALGPRPRDYHQRTPRKMIQLALRSALSDRAGEGHVMVISEWPWSTPRTADAKAALDALGVTGKTLIVLDDDADDVAYRSFRNLPDVQLLLGGELNAYDVLCNDWVVFTQRTLPGEGRIVSEPRPAATTPSEETPPPETAAGDVPTDEVPTGEVPTGDRVSTDAVASSEEES